MSQRILIIDDEAPIRLLYEEEFSRIGYRVAVEACGDTAMSIVADRKFDVVILDIELPDISGLEILKGIRRASPQTRIILNSAYHVYKSDFQSWLADAYIVKSSDLTELKDKVRELLEVT